MLDKLAPNLLLMFDQQYANRPSNNTQPANQPINFFKVEDRRYRLRHPVMTGGLSVSPLVEGRHNDPRRNFKWLPWLPGKISYTPLRSTPVLTGEMSGCWLMIFRLNGEVCFGHIGTYQDSNHPHTLDAINAWKIAVRSRKVTPVRAFNPVQVGAGTPKTFGAATSNRQLYTIGLDKVQPQSGAFPYKVVHVTHAAAAPVAPPY